MRCLYKCTAGALDLLPLSDLETCIGIADGRSGSISGSPTACPVLVYGPAVNHFLRPRQRVVLLMMWHMPR